MAGFMLLCEMSARQRVCLETIWPVGDMQELAGSSV